MVRSFAVEGAVDRRLPGPTGTATLFLVVREISRDPRIAALLDAVDEPVYELELGADGIWRTTAGTGIARILGVKGADELVLQAAVLEDDRAVFEAHRVRRQPGRRRAPSSACARRRARCGGCGSARRAAARATA